MTGFVFSNLNADGTDELYATDGTAGGTTDLQASRYGFLPAASVSPDFLTLGNDVLFVGTGLTIAGDLNVIYRSDGTAIGTSDALISGIGGTLSPSGLWAVGDSVLTSGATATGVQGLYTSTDGVTFSEIEVGFGVGPSGIVVSGGVGYFGAVDDTGRSLGLWRTDGTAAGTASVATQPVNPYGFASAGKTTVFAAAAGIATALWVTDGTASGTSPLQVPALANAYAESSLVSLGSKVLFTVSSAPDALDAATLWATDGTVGGTTELSDLTGVSLAAPDVLLGLNKAVFAIGSTPYITDGTAAGTTQIPTPAQQVQQFVTLGHDVIYLGTVDGAVSLFAYDAGSGSTTQITLPSVNLAGSTLSLVGSQVIFAAADPSGTEALFSTDGTQAGTRELALPAGVTLRPDSPPFIASLPTLAPPPPAGTVVTLGGGAQDYVAVAGTTVLAGSGDDTITAAAGQVTVVGSAGSLAFLGGSGASSVTGGAGSGTIFGGSGGGYFDGGRAGFNVLVSQGAGGANTSLTGGGAGDQIFGSASGNDVLVAGPGRDSILGGSGHTTIQGGSTASVVFTAGGSSVVFGGTGGGDTIVGGSGSLDVDAQKGDAIFGGGGALNVTGSKSGADSIIGGSGALSVDGQGGNMLVVAASSNSSIQVGNGASLIFTGSGSSTVTGGAGSLQMVLGSGASSVSEGAGPAVYDVVKGAAGGADVLNGYRPAADQIRLFGYQASDLQVSVSGGSSVVTLTDGTRIDVVGVTELGTSIVV